MTRVLPFLLLCIWLLAPAPATAEAPTRDADWLAALRHSGSYKEGMEKVRAKIEFAYDRGAVIGASHFETIHGYQTELARTKGCEKGLPFADGPVQECHQVSARQPKLLGPPYEKGHAEVAALPLEPRDAALVRKVLLVIYDYGYVQGMKHGLRKHNDGLRWTQDYYRACMSRANDSEHESTCARSSKQWSNGVLKSLRKRVEAHGLPVGKEQE